MGEDAGGRVAWRWVDHLFWLLQFCQQVGNQVTGWERMGGDSDALRREEPLVWVAEPEREAMSAP